MTPQASFFHRNEGLYLTLVDAELGNRTKLIAPPLPKKEMDAAKLAAGAALLLAGYRVQG